MSAMTSQFTSLKIVYSTVYSWADQRKHQSSASLAFVRGLHRRPVNSPHKGPVTRKIFPFDDVIMVYQSYFVLIFVLICCQAFIRRTWHKSHGVIMIGTSATWQQGWYNNVRHHICWVYCSISRRSSLLIWIRFNASVDEKPHMTSKVWDKITYPFTKAQLLQHHLTLRMDKQFYPPLYHGCNYLSILVLKLMNINKMCYGDPDCKV